MSRIRVAVLIGALALALSSVADEPIVYIKASPPFETLYIVHSTLDPPKRNTNSRRSLKNPVVKLIMRRPIAHGFGLC